MEGFSEVRLIDGHMQQVVVAWWTSSDNLMDAVLSKCYVVAVACR